MQLLSTMFAWMCCAVPADHFAPEKQGLSCQPLSVALHPRGKGSHVSPVVLPDKAC